MEGSLAAGCARVQEKSNRIERKERKERLVPDFLLRSLRSLRLLQLCLFQLCLFEFLPE
jgi:hypothetical protein